MSDQKSPLEQFSEEIQRIKASESYAQQEINSAKAKTVPVTLRLDPAVLLDQLFKLRQEGVDESTIKAALDQAMEAAQGEPRRAMNSMKAHRDAPKMPTQEEINQVYVNRYAHGIDDTAIRNDSVAAVIDAINAAHLRKSKLPPPPPLRVRIAVYFVRKVLSGLILLCKALGVK